MVWRKFDTTIVEDRAALEQWGRSFGADYAHSDRFSNNVKAQIDEAKKILKKFIDNVDEDFQDHVSILGDYEVAEFLFSAGFVAGVRSEIVGVE